jgi:hypothetical protein
MMLVGSVDCIRSTASRTSAGQCLSGLGCSTSPTHASL